MATVVSPHARYLVELDGDWKCVSLERFRELRPRAATPERGVLELFAQQCSFDWVDGAGMHHSAELPLQPVFLQDGRGSTMYEAVDKAVPLRFQMRRSPMLGFSHT
eukprot:2074536-Pyramimonas_sp.AAC.1